MALPTSTPRDMNIVKNVVTILANRDAVEADRLKAAQQLIHNFDAILDSPHYDAFVTFSVESFLKILREEEPCFILEYNLHQVRKLLLDMLYRLPRNDTLEPYVKLMVSSLFQVLIKENEENAIVCLRIIVELYKHYRPAFSVEIQRFLLFVEPVFSRLPDCSSKILDPKSPVLVDSLDQLDIGPFLEQTCTKIIIRTTTINRDGRQISFHLIPRSVLSLKFLNELVVLVTLIYKLHKENVHQEIANIIQPVIKTITLQSKLEIRNQEILLDLMTVQIRCLSFVVLILKEYQEIIIQHAGMIACNIIMLLSRCSPKIAHLRRELLLNTKCMMGTVFSIYFVPYTDRLLDKSVLLGPGYTVHETLRPLAYTTLADFIQKNKNQLKLPHLVRAVHLFSKNIHDESLPLHIQTMSCEFLLNVMECTKFRSVQDYFSQGRDIWKRILEVFVLKFKEIAKIQLPRLINNCKQQTSSPAQLTNSVEPGKDVNFEDSETDLLYSEKRPRIYVPRSTVNYKTTEYFTLMKTLILGVKTIAWGFSGQNLNSLLLGPSRKLLQHYEILTFIRFVKYALSSFDIYTLPHTPPGAVDIANETVGIDEQKGIFEHFVATFYVMHPQIFREIFSVTIDDMIERTEKNSSLLPLFSLFLHNSASSPVFAKILVEYLVKRMTEIGLKTERSHIYLKLFKQFLGSISVFPRSNESILKQHLHEIVNKSVQLAMTAKEPMKYFYLLRALFRSIGASNQDTLQQEFLPLLPNLLEVLNRLQSGIYKQHMKELLVELCLTVPVQITTLLPHLNLIMNPLISALNGSKRLMTQGLKTLELCLDVLHLEFVYENFSPVRAAMMEALCKITRTENEEAQVAFRILGKLGSGFNSFLTEAQNLEYVTTDPSPAVIEVSFDMHSLSDLPIDKIIETASTALIKNSAGSFYLNKAWEVIQCYLAASLNLSDNKELLLMLFTYPKFHEMNIPQLNIMSYKCVTAPTKETHATALVGMFVAATRKELNNLASETMLKIVQHYTMVAIAQQVGPFAITSKQVDNFTLDPLVLIDALALIMGHEEKKFRQPGYAVMSIIKETANNILSSEDKVCSLVIMKYLSERMCSLCYERAWYTKFGGCCAIRFLCNNMALSWVYEHACAFLKALLFVMMDLTDEISNGTTDFAKTILEEMLLLCIKKPGQIQNQEQAEDHYLLPAQSKALYEITYELVKHVTSPVAVVKEQAILSLRTLAKKEGKSVTELMTPHKDVLADVIPPKKHFLQHQPVNAQIGIIDGNAFCTSLKPRLFTYDLNIIEHKMFVHELLTICESDDSVLMYHPAYKSVSNFIPLRKSALQALAACHYIQPKNYRDHIFNVLYKSLELPNYEIQEAAFESLKYFLIGYQVDIRMVHELTRPLLSVLADYQILDLHCMKGFVYLSTLIPTIFNRHICQTLFEMLNNLCENVIRKIAVFSQNDDDVQRIIHIIDILQRSPFSSSEFVPSLCEMIFRMENAARIETSSPFKLPLLKFLCRFPVATINYFLDDAFIREPYHSRYLEYLLKKPEGKPLREYLQTNVIPLFETMIQPTTPARLDKKQIIVRYKTLRIVYILLKQDQHWIKQASVITRNLHNLWNKGPFLERHKRIENMEYLQWQEPRFLAKILLKDVSANPKSPADLFYLLKSFCGRYMSNFQFLKDFLENEVIPSYSVEWRREAFLKYICLFPTNTLSPNLRAKIIQLILIPCFAVSFQRGETAALIGSAPTAGQPDENNIVSVFINKLITPVVSHPDNVRVALLQFSCLLVEYAAPYIYNASNKQHAYKIRQLVNFVWPSIVSTNIEDPLTKYHGYVLLSLIFEKFTLHKTMIFEVFSRLATAHGVEARPIVRQALEILMPCMQSRVPDGYAVLVHWTRKIILEEGHHMPQLLHIFKIIVTHFKVYYPVRHDVMRYIVNFIQELGHGNSAPVLYKYLAFELSEIIIKWELIRIKNQRNTGIQVNAASNPTPGSLIHSAGDDSEDQRKKAMLALAGSRVNANKPIARVHADVIVNFLLRLACQENDNNATVDSTAVFGYNLNEDVSRRCIPLLKIALKPHVLPQVDLNLEFLENIFATVQLDTENFRIICKGFELLIFLLSVMEKEQILNRFKPLEQVLGVWITCTNHKVMRVVYEFLSKLMAIFPPQPVKLTDSATNQNAFEHLYSAIDKEIFESLTNYRRTLSARASTIFGTLMLLKAACVNNKTYIDRVMKLFMNILHRLTREHLYLAKSDNASVTSELLILGLDLVKTRVVAMGINGIEYFIKKTLIDLIENTADRKIMKAIIEILEEWTEHKNYVKSKAVPSAREKLILFTKLGHYIEKHFRDDLELNAQFLEVVHYIYRDNCNKKSELNKALAPIFLGGLVCNQPHIRIRYFETFTKSMKRTLFDRLMFIVCSQNWEAMGAHYWITQCIELLLSIATPNIAMKMSYESSKLPDINYYFTLAEQEERSAFENYVKLNFEEYNLTIHPEDMLQEFTTAAALVPQSRKNRSVLPGALSAHADFLKRISNICSDEFLLATAQLCHMDTSLAENVWVSMFPKIWALFDQTQKSVLSGKISQFLLSGIHLVQKDCQPSALNTFVEGMSRCNPPIEITPSLMKYVGRSHNLWHRMTLNLENIALDTSDFGEDASYTNDLNSSLGELYSLLREEDMWAALWKRHAHYLGTKTAIEYEQQGLFTLAQLAYENVMGKYKSDIETENAPCHTEHEIQIWMKEWYRCAKELNQWESISQQNKQNHPEPDFLTEMCWRIPKWEEMEIALAKIEHNCPEEFAWKAQLYKGYLAIYHPTKIRVPLVEEYVQLASTICMAEWRKLPHIVSHIHGPYLHDMQRVIELQEAAQIYEHVIMKYPSSLSHITTILKAWQNRLPSIADDFVHWANIFTWRQHIYNFIDEYPMVGEEPINEIKILGINASTQATIRFAKTARKQNLPTVCLDLLNRIYDLLMPISDCFDTTKQHIKSLIHMSSLGDTNALEDAWNVLNEIHLEPDIAKNIIGKLFGLKGRLLFLGHSPLDEIYNQFSAAVQLDDKAWCDFGIFLEQVFMQNPNNTENAVHAIVCFLHASMCENESKSRKYLSKVLWLLNYDDNTSSLMCALEKYGDVVPAAQWLPWIPQLLNCLVKYDGTVILNLLLKIAEKFPQAIYFPVRTLYLQMRTKEWLKQADVSSNIVTSEVDIISFIESNTSANTATDPVKSTPAMLRCSKIIQLLKNLYPIIVDSLESIAGQLVWFRESWYDDVLKELKQALTQCYAVAFKNKDAVSNTEATPHISNLVKKFLVTFINGIDGLGPATSESAASESSADAEATYEDVKINFIRDFECCVENVSNLRSLIHKLRKWIKILETKSDSPTASFFLEEKCTYLSQFNLKTGQIVIPGQYLQPGYCQNSVYIAKFLPRVSTVKKYNVAARRLCIRGHNGKIYPYLVINNFVLADAIREERVMQLLRMLNQYFGSQKETSKRYLHFTVPRVVTVSPEIRLVEDNPASLSLLDIYQQRCSSTGVEYDSPIMYFYEKLAAVQSCTATVDHQVYRDIFNDIQSTIIPKTILKNWALNTYPSATDYWHFRKMITLQMSLACFAEYVLNLTRLNPDMMYFHQDSGLMDVSYFKFDCAIGESDIKPVPFRMTPNIAEFLSSICINGPLTASITAVCRCLARPNSQVKSILFTILHDEVVTVFKNKYEEIITDIDATYSGNNFDRMIGNLLIEDNKQVVSVVIETVEAICEKLNTLADLNNSGSEVNALVTAATDCDNLCRMDPHWHPWI